jgi:hypothetical protein
MVDTYTALTLINLGLTAIAGYFVFVLFPRKKRITDKSVTPSF